MARSTIYPQPQADGDLVAPWSFPFSGSGHLNLEEADGWITTDGTDTTQHSAQVSHGITTTGDWQVSYLADSISGNAAGTLICSTGYTGYWVRFDSFISVRTVVGGAPGAAIISTARTAGAHVPAFIECTYVASTDTFELFEDGVSRGSATNSTYEATDKSLLIPIMSQSSGVRNRIRDFYIQDFVQVLGRPPRQTLVVAPPRTRRNLYRRT